MREIGSSIDSHVDMHTEMHAKPMPLRMRAHSSQPVFGGVYKLVAVEDEAGTVIPKIKVSENVDKITNPHFKKVYRIFDKATGKAEADYITVWDERVDESRSLELLSRTADAGARYGMPTLGVVAVGKEMERTEKFFLLATRVLAENGANIVKSYYCEGFERVAAACPVPIVIAGGKKLPELEALESVAQAVKEALKN